MVVGFVQTSFQMIDRIYFYLCIIKLTQDSLMLIKNVPDVKNVSVKKKNRDGHWDESGITILILCCWREDTGKLSLGWLRTQWHPGMKYNSHKQSFLLEIFYIHGTDVTAQNMRIRDIVGNFVESHVDRYSHAEISSTLQEILSISDDPCITWIDGEAFPLTNARKKSNSKSTRISKSEKVDFIWS